MNREDVVQAALTVERWCREHYTEEKPCDCPFLDEDDYNGCRLGCNPNPIWCNLEEFLRTRGLERGCEKKKLSPNEMLTKLEIEYIQERLDWETIYKYGCRDPFWPDGTNLNLIRNHCIFYKRQMEEICQEHNIPLPETLPLPDEVDEDYMAPYGRFPNRLVKSNRDEYFQTSLEFFVEEE